MQITICKKIILLFLAVAIITPIFTSRIDINTIASPSQASVSTFADTYDDFRVDTSATGMNRWETIKSGSDTSLVKVPGSRTLTTDYQSTESFYATSLYDDFENGDYNTPVNWTEWWSDRVNYDPIWNPVEPGGVFRNLATGTPATDPEQGIAYTVAADNLPFNLTVDFHVDARDSGSNIDQDNLWDVKVSQTWNSVGNCYRYYWKNDNYGASKETERRFEIWEDWGVTEVDVQSFSSGFHEGNITFSIDENYCAFYLDNVLKSNTTLISTFNPDSTFYISFYGADGVIFTGYADNVNFDNVEVKTPLTGDLSEYLEPRYISFEREVDAGTYESQVTLDTWTYVNCTSNFTTGIETGSGDRFYIEINDDNLSFITPDASYELTTESNIQDSYEFSTRLTADEVSFGVSNGDYSIYQTYSHSSRITDLTLFFTINQSLPTDALAASIYYVEASFKNADPYEEFNTNWESAWGLTADAPNVKRHTPEQFDFVGNQSGVARKISYTYFIQDFRSLSGIIKAWGHYINSWINFEVKIAGVNASGIIDISESGESGDYLLKTYIAHVWSSSTGFATAYLQKVTNSTNYVQYLVQDAINTEVGFYFWLKSDTLLQSAIRYQDVNEDKQFSDMTNRLSEDTPVIGTTTGWYAVKFTYDYFHGSSDGDSWASAGISALKVIKGGEIEEPVIAVPSSPIIYNPPAGLLEGFINAILSPFLWIGGIIGAIIGIIIGMPEAIITLVIAYYMWIFGDLIPAILAFAEIVMEIIFEAFPVLGDLWRLLESLVNIVLDIVDFGIVNVPIFGDLALVIINVFVWIMEIVAHWVTEFNDNPVRTVRTMIMYGIVIASIPFAIRVIASDDKSTGECFAESIPDYIFAAKLAFMPVIFTAKALSLIAGWIIGFIGGIIP